MINNKPAGSLLLVANWDSDVGYAWWLMESFWTTLAERYAPSVNVILAYPSISKLPDVIRNAPLTAVAQTIGEPGWQSLASEWRFLKRNRIKAIYFSDRASVSPRYLAYRLAGVRLVIVHDHTPGQRTPPKGLKRAFKWLAQRTPYFSADGLIGASEFVRKRFTNINCSPPDKCFAAANGLPDQEPATHDHPAREIFSIPSSYPIAVMTGRAHHYKNVTFILRCLAKLKAQGHRLYFLFCGDGPHLAGFKAEALRLGVDDIVSFAGQRADVRQLLPQCDFAVHSSKGEVGYSLSILEYMQAGLPVIVPDNPSVCGATINNETGLVYQEDNENAFIEAVIIMLSDPASAQRMGENAKVSVATKFSLSATHNSLLAAFESIDRNGILKKSHQHE